MNAKHFLIFTGVCLFQNIWIVSSTVALNVSCNHSKTSAKLTYVGDPLAVVAIDSTGDAHYFDEDTAKAYFSKVIPFNDPAGSLSFTKKETFMEVYTIVVMTRNTYRDYETSGDDAFLVECNFASIIEGVAKTSVKAELPEDFGSRRSGMQPVLDEVPSEDAVTPSSTVELELVHVNGKKISGSVRIGRPVKIKAIMTAAGSDVGFRVHSCIVQTEKGKENVTILALGCGTGFPFPVTEGFQIRGLIGFSPVFTMFGLKSGKDIVFKCQFTVCTTNCDGDSCESAVERKKRSYHELMTSRNSVNLVTDIVDLSS